MNFLNVNPGLDIFGLHVAWYGILIAFGMFAAIIIASKLSKYRGLNGDDILGVALCVIPLCIIGARAYYILFSGRTYTFVEALQVWNGGMAIYGGIIGGAVGALLYSLIKKKNFLCFTDTIAPCLALGQAIGRWGNFINQEAYGNLITNTSFQWFPFGVYIPKSNFTAEATQQVVEAFGTSDVAGAWFNATFFYESFLDLIIFFALVAVLVKLKKTGIVTAGYFIIYGIGRAIIEGFRTDSLYIPNTTFRVSQLLSIILIAVGIIMIAVICIIEHKKRKNNTIKS